jgi:hypothetical protein
MNTNTQLPDLVIGDRYNWKNQPERLIYIRVKISNGLWYQFAKVEEPEVVWCEVRKSDLIDFERTITPVIETEPDFYILGKIAFEGWRGMVTEEFKGPTWDDLGLTKRLQWMSAALAIIEYKL